VLEPVIARYRYRAIVTDLRIVMLWYTLVYSILLTPIILIINI
jgi:hypothetical protein